MSNTRFTPIDETARELVRSEVGGMLVVEAGAGTGKTTLLIDRLLTLLASNDISQLVAITFTEKAAGELADRLRRELERQVATEPTGSVNLSKALASIDSGNISTIHAFASSILKAFPIDAGIDPDFEVLEPEDAKELLDEALADELGRVDAGRDADLQLFIEFGARMSRIRSLFATLADNSDLAQHGFRIARDDEILAKMTAVVDKVRQLDQQASSSALDLEDKGIVNIHRVAESLKTLSSENDWKELYGWVEQVAGIRGNAGTVKSWRDQGEGKQFKADYAELKAMASRSNRMACTNIFGKALNRLAIATGKLHKQKLDFGKLTFDDLLTLSLRLLEDPEVLSILQAKYAYLLIDEFQDTDPVQARIALKLAGIDESSGDILKAPTGRICVVGDPKQSIYRFRRADSRMFDQATSEIERFGSRVQIVQNFRSAAGVIDFVNSFFTPIWLDACETGKGGYLPLVTEPGRPASNPDPPVLFITPPEGESFTDFKASEARMAEAEAISSTIKQAVVDERWQVGRKNAGGSRDLQPAGWGDVAILFPRTTELDTYTDALERYDIPYAIVGGKATFRRQLAVDLLNLISAIDNPADTLSVVGALRSSLLAVPDDELAIWKDHSPELNYLDALVDLPEHLSDALSLLYRLHEMSRSEAPDKILQTLIDATDAKVALLSGVGGVLDAELLDIVLNQAKRWGIERGTDLRGFRRRLARMIESGDDPDSTPPPTSVGRVRLMTIHAAKGLEFPIVFLANLGKGNVPQEVKIIPDRIAGRLHLEVGNGKDEPRFSTEGFEEAEAGEDRELQAEKMRLLYVAMTRACDHLVLPIFRAKKSDSDYQKMLAEYVSGDAIFKNRQESMFRVLRLTGDPSSSQAETSVETVEFDGIISTRNDLIRLRSESADKLAEASTKYLRPSSMEAEDADRDRDAVPSIELSLRIGSALHKYMSLTSLTVELDVELLRSIAAEEGVLTDHLRQKVEGVLNSSVWRSAIDSGRVWRETPVLVKKGDAFIRGVVDLLWRENGKVMIADYKSGQIGRSEQIRQLQTYADAVEVAIGERPVNGWLISAENGKCVDVLAE